MDSREKPPMDRRPVVIAALVAALLAVLSFSGAGAVFELDVARPIAFKFRALFDQEPALASRLKIFAFEDRSASEVGYTDFNLNEWSKVLKAIAARRPKVILLDKAFTHPFGSKGAANFVKRLKASGVPIVARALITSYELQYLTKLPVETYARDKESLYSSARSVVTAPRKPTWLNERAFFPYGPTKTILPAFHAIGHAAALESGYLTPLVYVGSDRTLLHWSFYATDQTGLVDGRLMSGGHEVPVDDDGRIPVNLVPFSRYLERMQSLHGALEFEREGKPITTVQPGDVVVVLPNMYTGAIDFERTAIGRLPAEFIAVSAINSVITGDWLQIFGGTIPLGVIWTFAGAWFASRMRRKLVWPAVFGLAVGTWALAMAAFIWGNTLVSWILPVTGLVLAALGCYADALAVDARKAALMRHDLDGVLNPAKLQKILERRANLEATEQVVTIMFIDIVGFSRAAEKQTPKEAFSSLKVLIDDLRKTVHEFGGDVDRTLGDGMLCVFGYDLDEGGGRPMHADHAVQCAAKIQLENLKRIMKAEKTKSAVFPVRIGINTTNVFIGNLGDSEKLDFTVIGNGVNFAQRLEAACDRHMVMIGASTSDMLSPFPAKDSMIRRRFIRIKHHEDLVEAYEVDPFWDDPKMLNDGDEAYRQYIGVERSDTRWPVPIPGAIRVLTNYGDGDLVNFSQDGFTIKLNGYYAVNVAMSMKLDSPDGELGERLERAGLLPIVLEVRWARPAGDGYIHGCLIKNLTREHRDDIINMLRDALHRGLALARSA